MKEENSMEQKLLLNHEGETLMDVFNYTDRRKFQEALETSSAGDDRMYMAATALAVLSDLDDKATAVITLLFRIIYSDLDIHKPSQVAEIVANAGFTKEQFIALMVIGLDGE